MSDDLVKQLREGVIEHRKRLMMQAADRIEALEARAEKAEAERDALREALRKAEAALADIAEGEPDPDDTAEKIWCKGRAAAALTEARAALNREDDT